MLRPAGSDPTSWLVYLEGGYWCWDSESCTERYQTDKFDMSSSGWKSQFAQEGIFGTDPATNPFANFNKVRAPCVARGPGKVRAKQPRAAALALARSARSLRVSLLARVLTRGGGGADLCQVLL